MDALHAKDIARHRRQMQVLLPRNYWAHSIEGGLYMGGMAFLSAQALGGPMIKALGGPAWLVASMPLLGMVGFQLPGLFVAHRLERLNWVKPLVALTGIFQRLPFLLAGLVLLLFSNNPPLMLAAVALCPLVSGLVAGVSQPAWMELLAKTLPENRRSSVWAIRFLLAGVIGLAAGFVAHWMLGKYSLTVGYGLLHLITFSFLTASYIVFCMIREPRLPARPSRESQSIITNLSAVPGIIRRDVQFRRFLLARAWMLGTNIMVPWLSLYVLTSLGRGEEYAGTFITMLMIGSISGNLLSGYLGDRMGSHKLLLISGTMLLASCVAPMLVSGEWAFLSLFVLMGAATSSNSVGVQVMTLDIVPLARRATYLSIVSAASIPFMIMSWLLSTLLWKYSGGYFPAVAIPAAIAVLISLYFQWRIIEPRQLMQTETLSDQNEPAAPSPEVAANLEADNETPRL